MKGRYCTDDMHSLKECYCDNTPRKATHTQTPWIGVPQSNGSTMIAREFETGEQMNPKGLRIIAFTMARGNSLTEDEANAALIVHRVNIYDELVEAIKNMQDALGHDECGGSIDDCAACEIVDLLRRATGEGK